MFGLDRLIPHIHPALQPGTGCNWADGRVLDHRDVFSQFPEGMAIAAGGVVDMGPPSPSHWPSRSTASGGRLHIGPLLSRHRKAAEGVSGFLGDAVPVVGVLHRPVCFRHPVAGMDRFIIGATAGLMIYITVDELIPKFVRGGEPPDHLFPPGGVALVIVLGSL
jgi:ZIP family zinc transporter